MILLQTANLLFRGLLCESNYEQLPYNFVDAVFPNLFTVTTHKFIIC